MPPKARQPTATGTRRSSRIQALVAPQAAASTAAAPMTSSSSQSNQPSLASGSTAAPVLSRESTPLPNSRQTSPLSSVQPSMASRPGTPTLPRDSPAPGAVTSYSRTPTPTPQPPSPQADGSSDQYVHSPAQSLSPLYQRSNCLLSRPLSPSEVNYPQLQGLHEQKAARLSPQAVPYPQLPRLGSPGAFTPSPSPPFKDYYHQQQVTKKKVHFTPPSTNLQKRQSHSNKSSINNSDNDFTNENTYNVSKIHLNPYLYEPHLRPFLEYSDMDHPNTSVTSPTSSHTRPNNWQNIISYPHILFMCMIWYTLFFFFNTFHLCESIALWILDLYEPGKWFTFVLLALFTQVVWMIWRRLNTG